MKKRNIIAVFSAVACLALLTIVQAAPTPETPDPGAVGGSFSTADGINALANNTGAANSAFGWWALFANTDASFSTAVGAGALLFNNGGDNTAVGAAALLFNATGTDNTAIGAAALVNNTSNANTAVGSFALNQASAHIATFNTAVGFQALQSANANANAAVGDLALQNVTTGFFNTAIGAAAGVNQTDGHNNIYIGQGSFGVAGENNTCYIQGIAGSSVPTANAAFVYVDTATGKLGTVLANADGNRMTVPIPQNHLQPAPQGKYEAVPQRAHEDGRQATLNQLLKQQKRIAELEGAVGRLTAMVKEQAAQLQKVSAQLEIVKPATKVALTNQ